MLEKIKEEYNPNSQGIHFCKDQNVRTYQNIFRYFFLVSTYLFIFREKISTYLGTIITRFYYFLGFEVGYDWFYFQFIIGPARLVWFLKLVAVNCY